MAASPTPLFSRRSFIQSLAIGAGWPGVACAVGVSARPAATLARPAPLDIDPTGYLVSEKFDGVRALWDGHALRFRSGRAVAAPAWFLAQLPSVALDGELWLARGRFETLSGAVRRATPRDEEWQGVRYLVFELPGAAGDFAARAAAIERVAARTAWPQLVAVEQAALADRSALQRRLEAVLREGGEGLMLHRADAAYAAGRSDALLKLKPVQDAEATVMAHLPGQGRLAGQMGALRVRSESGAAFDLGTGFSDAQRRDPPPIGTVVTYTHRGHTGTGVPRFASFLRVRGAE